MTHNKTPLEVPREYWEQLSGRDTTRLCTLTLAQPHPLRGMVLRCLKDDVWVDVQERTLRFRKGDQWEPAENPLLELVTLLYLNNVHEIFPACKEMIGPMDLKEAHYFKGKHALPLGPLLERYGYDLKGFRHTAETLGGKVLEMGDAGYVLYPFPRVALRYLLWAGDEEFKPKISVLFDRSIEKVFSASAIWALVSLVSAALLRGPEARPWEAVREQPICSSP